MTWKKKETRYANHRARHVLWKRPTSKLWTWRLGRVTFTSQTVPRVLIIVYRRDVGVVRSSGWIRFSSTGTRRDWEWRNLHQNTTPGCRLVSLIKPACGVALSRSYQTFVYAYVIRPIFSGHCPVQKMESFASRKIFTVEMLETLPEGTKLRTSYHRSPEETGVERGSDWRFTFRGWNRATVNEILRLF